MVKYNLPEKHFMDQKIYKWWDSLPHATRKSFEGDLDRLGMDIKRDQYYFSTYEYGNLLEPTRRAITRLYQERHGARK